MNRSFLNRLAPAVAMLAFLGAAVPSLANSATKSASAKAATAAADKVAIHTVIQKQIAAFQRDDGDTAFHFTAPGLRARFHTPAIFMRMVRESYEPVYRPAQVSFGPLEDVQGMKVQHVLVVGTDGLTHEALYFMEHEFNGTWLIGGCMLVESKLTPA